MSDTTTLPESVDPIGNEDDTATDAVDLTQLDDDALEKQAKELEEEMDELEAEMELRREEFAPLEEEMELRRAEWHDIEREKNRRKREKELSVLRNMLTEQINAEKDISRLNHLIGILSGDINPSKIGKIEESKRRVFIENGSIFSQKGSNKKIRINGISFNAATGIFAMIPETTEGFGRGKGLNLDKQGEDIKKRVKELWPDDFEKYEATMKVTDSIIEQEKKQAEFLDHENEVHKNENLPSLPSITEVLSGKFNSETVVQDANE